MYINRLIILPTDQFIHRYLHSISTILFIIAINMHTLIILITILTQIHSQCTNNCLLCLTPPACSLCQTNYALTIYGNCTAHLIPNCRVYASPSTSQLCQSTFQSVNGICVKDYSGCVSRTYQGTCNFCSFGTTLSGNACKGILNCELMANNECQKCLKGYNLKSGICVESRSECVTQSAGACTECATGYILNGFTCLKPQIIPPGCELYDPWNGRCMVCSQGYEMKHQFCQRVDRLADPASSQQFKLVQNALAMPVDILTDSDSPPITKATYSVTDLLLPRNFDLEIKVFSSSGNTNSKDSCWQKAANGSCRVCREGYILSNDICVVSTICIKYAPNGKTCLTCNDALVSEKGWCTDKNCAVSVFSRCSVCKQAAYKPNAQGICINENCTNFVGGKCLGCSTGYTLDNNSLCISNNPTNNIVKSSTIKNCELVQNSLCVRCSPNYFPNNSGGCKRVVIGCIKMDANQQNCLQCINIYYLDSTGGCQFGSAPNTNSINNSNTNSSTINNADSSTLNNSTPFSADDNCKVQNKGSCAACKLGYILNTFNFTCLPVSKQCATYNTTDGTCITCIPNYIIFNGWCLTRANSTDPACLVSTINNFCSTCKNSYFIDRGTCKTLNPLCKTSQIIGGACLTCYSGYVLFNGNCISVSQQPACQTYDFNSICITCYNRFYLLTGVCLPVSPLCFNYNTSTGQCIDCIPGYGLSSLSGGCEVQQPSPPNCARADPTGKCLTCNNRFFINSSGLCQSVAPLCQNYNQNGGNCSSCFPTYKLMQDNTCLNVSLVLGCISANTNGLCKTCIPQYVLTPQGTCLLRDANCFNYTNGSCVKCAPLYYLHNSTCIKETPKTKDPNCMVGDLYNYCQQCNAGYYISQGNCLLADQMCKTFDPSNGNCLSCYDGYRLNNNKCYLNNPIFNCQLFNGIVCVQCEAGYNMIADGSCTP